MSPGPIRRVGSQSRAANINALNRDSGLRYSLAQSGAGPKHLFDQGLDGRDPDDATRVLTPMDLSLPPFRTQQVDTSAMYDEPSEENLGPLACQPINEDALEDVDGMPTRTQWKAIVEGYLASLHPSKRHKSLISQEVYKMIFRTLKDPDATRLGTPQFRFWARKMFQLVEAPNNILVVTNGGRPVAIKEHIYDILCMCHSECGHGGRDKTCKVLREYYTWVPKELISNFVKECPSCAPRKLAASRSKDRKSEATPAILEERLLGAPRYSVERLQDFGQLPSPASDEPHQFKVPPHNGHPSSMIPQFDSIPNLSRANNSEKYFIPVNFPSNKSISTSSKVVLPPLSSIEPDTNIESGVNKKTPLPPLMQYLSRKYEPEDSSQGIREADVGARVVGSEIPIDPVLLTTTTPHCTCDGLPCSKCTAPSGDIHGNALHLQLRPPTTQDLSCRDAQAPIEYSPGHSETREPDATAVVWEFPSVASMYGGDTDNSTLFSASTASIGLPTPLPSGQISPVASGYVAALEYFPPGNQSVPVFQVVQYGFENGFDASSEKESELSEKAEPNLYRRVSPPLFSPRPVKVENTKAVLELAAAAEVEEIDH